MSNYIVIIASCNDDDVSEVTASVIGIDAHADHIAQVFTSFEDAKNAMVTFCEQIVSDTIEEHKSELDEDEPVDEDSNIACWDFETDTYSKTKCYNRAWISISEGFIFFQLKIIQLGDFLL